MAFKDQGFLGLASERPELRGHQRELAIATQVNALAMRTVWDLQVDTGSKERAIGVLLFIRGLRAYQSALLLAERGLCIESQVMCRAGIECVIQIAKLARDRDFVHVLERAHDRHRITQAEKMALYGDRLPPEVRAQVEKLAAQVKPSDASVQYEQLAEEVGLGVLYQVLYRGSSGFAAHATIGALQSHVRATPEGFDFQFAPQWRQLTETLAAVIPVGLELLSQVAVLFELPDLTQQCLQLSREWQTLCLEAERPARVAGPNGAS